MDWWVLERPGTSSGPCKGSCDHRDCYADKALAKRPCELCGRAIGFDTKFVFLDAKEGGANHFVCELKAQDQKGADQ